ncbi:hypothetical protein [Lactobacillus sp. Sy-1]|uniref:hypothetical protein n=1 Tax=Lactobacillus sp. Sy-1 TaxID=2109645 RepID=UPI001C570F20|nr:hypothetical protein [Lactobacillus sp. Sy-1]MBW1605818.1 hypothetical protein [Lactobacillus sp. Sy-1]
MLVNVLTIIFAVIMFGIGVFVFTHQKKSFLVFHPESIPALSLLMKVFGIIFIICGLLFLIPLFLNNEQLLFWMLIIACFLVIGFQIAMAQYFGKK